MTLVLSKRQLARWIDEAITSFRTTDLTDIPESWLVIYRALADYIADEAPVDQRLLWMIEGTDDAPADMVYQLQRLKNALLRILIAESASEEASKVIAWFDRTIVILIERLSDTVSNERSLVEPYETVFWRARDGMYISTVEGKFIQCNDALVEMLGFESKEELLALDIRQELYKDPAERKLMLEHLYRDTHFDHHEIHLQCADGREKTAIESCYLVPDPSGSERIVGILVDVTEEKQIQEETSQYVKDIEKQGIIAQLNLRRQSKRTEALMALNDSPVLMLDPRDFRILDFNRAFGKRFKFGKKQIAKLNLRNVFPEQDWMDIYRRISQSVQRIQYHIRAITCQTSQGHTFTADLSILVHLDDMGALLFMQINDRSPMLNMKHLLRTTRRNVRRTIDEAPIGVIGFKSDANVATINKYLRDFLGYNQRELKDVNFVNNLFSREEQKLKFRKYINAFLRGEHADNVKVELKAKSGKKLTFLLNTISYQFEGEEEPGILGFLTNVTHETELARRLKSEAGDPERPGRRAGLQQQLAMAENNLSGAQNRNDFLQNFIQHTTKAFKIPIDVVLGYSSLLKTSLTDKLDESHQEDLDVITRHVESLGDMLEKSGQYARLEAKLVTVTAGERPLRAMLDSMFERLTPADIPADTSFSAGHQILNVDWKICLDAQILEDMLRQLIENGLHHAAGSSVQLTAQVEEGRLLVEVRDTGPGLDPIVLENLFKPFIKGSQAGARAERHLGLGLAIVKRYADLTGMHVFFENNDEGGTTALIDVGSVIGADSGKASDSTHA